MYSADSHPSPSHIHTSSHKRVAAFTHCAHICNTHMLNSVHYFSCCSPENRMEKVWLLRCWFCCWKIKREKKREPPHSNFYVFSTTINCFAFKPTHIVALIEGTPRHRKYVHFQDFPLFLFANESFTYLKY